MFDGEAGLQQNYYRDYDSAVGRYAESDPIGLAAGVNTYTYVNDQPVILADPFGLCPPGTHPATPDEIKKILGEAKKIRDQGLTHAQIQCNQFVDRSINVAFPGALPVEYNTTQMMAGMGPFQSTSTPSVGEFALFSDPGHVVFITGVTAGATTQFMGSQSRSGPATVDLPNKYWDVKINIPGNVLYLQSCLPN